MESIPSVPPPRVALPDPDKKPVSKEEGRERMQKIIDMIKPPKPGKEWAYKLMEREAKGETLPWISTQLWRQALGYAANTPIGDIERRRAP